MSRLGGGDFFGVLRTVPRALSLGRGADRGLSSLQALCAAVAGPSLLKNMTQLLCVEASEGEEPWSPSALDGSSFPGLLSPGNPCKCPPLSPSNNSQPQPMPWFFQGAALTSPPTKPITTDRLGSFPNPQILQCLFPDVTK